MKRRVVKHGNSTLTISLPVEWIKKFKIQAGHELDLEERGNKIIVRAGNDISEKEINIIIDWHENISKRILLSPYIHGYNLIKIKYNHPEVKTFIYEILQNYLIGFEIIEQYDNYFVLKNVAKEIEEEFDGLLNRLTLLVLARLKILLEVMKTNDYYLLDDNKNFEIFADKIALFCKRMLNITGNKDNKSNSFYSIINYLENISDAEYSIACYLIEKKIKVAKETIDFMEITVKYISFWHNLFLKFDSDILSRTKEIESKTIRDSPTIMNKFAPDQHFIIHCLLMIQEEIHNCCDELSY